MLSQTFTLRALLVDDKASGKTPKRLTVSRQALLASTLPSLLQVDGGWSREDKRLNPELAHFLRLHKFPLAQAAFLTPYGHSCASVPSLSGVPALLRPEVPQENQAFRPQLLTARQPWLVSAFAEHVALAGSVDVNVPLLSKPPLLSQLVRDVLVVAQDMVLTSMFEQDLKTPFRQPASLLLQLRGRSAVTDRMSTFLNLKIKIEGEVGKAWSRVRSPRIRSTTLVGTALNQTNWAIRSIPQAEQEVLSHGLRRGNYLPTGREVRSALSALIKSEEAENMPLPTSFWAP